MIRIQNFGTFNEELKSDIYRRAGAKLGKLGHHKRKERLEDWADKTKEKENHQKWLKKVEDFSIDGTYRFKFFNLKNELLLEDDFYIDISYDDINTVESLNKDGGYISFFLGIIPTTEESLIRCKEALPDIDYNNGHFWGGMITISYKLDGNQMVFSNLLLDPYDEEISGIIKITDRKTAVKLKNQLWEIFSGKEKYPSGYTDETDLKKKIEKDFADFDYLNQLDVKFSSVDLANWLRTISVNTLYRE